MTAELFDGRLGVQQRVLPTYRAAFFEALAGRVTGGLSVFAGLPLSKEGVESVGELQAATLVHAENINFLDPSSPWYMCWQGGLMRWLEEWQPEVLVVEANPRYPQTRKAIAWMHARKRKVIGWGLGAPPIQGALASLRQGQRGKLLSSLDGIIAYSQRGAGQYRGMGLPAERIYVASNAAMPAPTAPPAPRPPMFSGQPVILFVGRLQARKRVDLLLRACSALAESLRPRLVIVGDGPAMDEMQQVAQIVYPAAEFVGPKYDDELSSLYSAADLFVLPGTGGLAIQQAMAHGLPVLVAQGDGTQEDLVRDNGWLVPPGDQQVLVDRLNQALSDPARLRKMGEASYRIVAQDINVGKMVEVFIRAANEVCRK